MVKDSYAYDLVSAFRNSNQDILNLEVDHSLKDAYTEKINTQKQKLLVPTSTAFINTQEASAVGKYFEKHKVYTKAHPVYDKYEYRSFWDREEKRRKEGIVIPGELYKTPEGDYRLRDIHITGEHYGYLNYARISRIPENLITEDIEQLKKDSIAASKEVTFPDFWDGDFYYFKAIEKARALGKHLVVGKARRKGYSYKNGWVSANRVDLYPNTVTALAAYDSSSLYPKGTFTMANDYLQFIFDNTDWAKRRLRSSEDFIKFGYRLQNSPSVERGYKSILLAESFGKQPGILRGKDADVVIVEEAGKARNLSDFMDSTLPTLKAGKYVTGLMIVFGTGGGDDNYWEHFEELFFDPEIYDFINFENIFDKDGENESAGFFIPDFVNKEGFMDIYGNSNIKEAADYELDHRQKLKDKGQMKKLKDRAMESAFSPSEAFSRGSDNIFPKELIEEQLNRIKKDPLIKALKRNGNLKIQDGRIVFKDAKFMSGEELENFHPAIEDLKLNPSKDNHGSFIMFHAPYRDANGNIPDNLYRIWHDPFSVDKEKNELSSKHSFGCTYVYERTNNITPSRGNRLVGVYIGRPESTDAYNEVMYRISQFYNAPIFYEKNVGNVFNFFRALGELDRLVNEPKNIFDKEDLSKAINERKGIHINEQRKLNGAIYLKDWLLEKVDKDENGNWLRNVHYIYDEALLKELLKWNLKGNFDRVSTLIVGMYDIKEQYFVEVEEPLPATSNEGIFDREWN